MISNPLSPPRYAMPKIVTTSHLDKHAWDALVADDDFFHCHGWLSGLDYAIGGEEILALYSNSGLLGGCALWPGETEPGLFYLHDFFPGLRGPWDDEFIWGGARRSTHNEIPCIYGHHRAESLASIAAALADLAARRHKTAAVIPYMPLRRALEIKSCYPHARVLMHSAEAAIPVTSDGLGSLLSHVNGHQRTNIKAELAAFSRKGVQLECHPLSECLFEVAAKLIASTRDKYGSPQGAEWVHRLLDGQKKSSVTDTAITILAKSADKVVGISILYRFGKKMHIRYFGADYILNNHDFRYFVLAYYYPLDYAAKHGFTQCRLSISALKAKTLRGALLEPLAALLLFPGTPDLRNEDCERYNRAFLHTYQSQYAKYLNSDWEFIN